MNRRTFCNQLVGGGAAMAMSQSGSLLGEAEGAFKFRYTLASAMYGTMPLSDILPEVKKIGAKGIDIWPKVHGDQREQIEEMGHDKFQAMLGEHGLSLDAMSCYKLGPFGLQEEMKVAKKIDGEGKVFICAGRGEKGLEGAALKAEVKKFVELLKPHVEAAEEHGMTIAIENHGNNLIDHPDSLRWMIEMEPSKHLGIAFAPHHFENIKINDKKLNGNKQGKLFEELGHRVALYYAQQHGMGSKKKLPKEEELLQMPGRGKLDFGPTVQAMKKIKYTGLTEIFMHPVPRGVPILETAEEITAEINRSKAYLESLV